MTLAAIAIPEQLATVRLAGMPPVAGLFAFAAGSLGFAALGANRVMSVGADSTIAPVMAATLAGIAVVGTAQYGAMAGALSVLVGLLLLLTRPLRLAWAADLLSIPVTTGFLAGIAVHILAGQLPTALGIAAPVGGLLMRLAATASAIPQANPWTVGITVAVFGVCLAGDWRDARIPGALIGLVASGVAVWRFDLQRRGVPVIGPLPLGLPAVSFTLPGWDALAALLPPALLIALLCVAQTAAVSQAFPADPPVPQAAGRDFAAVGAGCILAALVGAFAVNASPPRTAVAVEAGGRTQIVSVLAVAIVAVVVLAASGAFAVVPHAALAGVLAFVAVRIVRIGVMRRIYQRSPAEMMLVAASAALVVVLPIGPGIGLAVVLSLVHSIYTIARPRCTELTHVPGTTVWWAPQEGVADEREADILVFAFTAPVTFVNARHLIAQLEAALAARQTVCTLVVIEANGVIDIDYTGANILRAAICQLRQRGIDVMMARLESPRAAAAAARTGLITTLGAGHLFRSVAGAVQAWRGVAWRGVDTDPSRT